MIGGGKYYLNMTMVAIMQSEKKRNSIIIVGLVLENDHRYRYSAIASIDGRKLDRKQYGVVRDAGRVSAKCSLLMVGWAFWHHKCDMRPTGQPDSSW